MAERTLAGGRAPGRATCWLPRRFAMSLGCVSSAAPLKAGGAGTPWQRTWHRRARWVSATASHGHRPHAAAAPCLPAPSVSWGETRRNMKKKLWSLQTRGVMTCNISPVTSRAVTDARRCDTAPCDTRHSAGEPCTGVFTGGVPLPRAGWGLWAPRDPCPATLTALFFLIDALIFASGMVNVLSKGKRSSSPGQGRGGKARGQFGQAMPRGLEGATAKRWGRAAGHGGERAAPCQAVLMETLSVLGTGSPAVSGGPRLRGLRDRVQDGAAGWGTWQGCGMEHSLGVQDGAAGWSTVSGCRMGLQDESAGWSRGWSTVAVCRMGLRDGAEAGAAGWSTVSGCRMGVQDGAKAGAAGQSRGRGCGPCAGVRVGRPGRGLRCLCSAARFPLLACHLEAADSSPPAPHGLCDHRHRDHRHRDHRLLVHVPPAGDPLSTQGGSPCRQPRHPLTGMRVWPRSVPAAREPLFGPR